MDTANPDQVDTDDDGTGDACAINTNVNGYWESLEINLYSYDFAVYKEELYASSGQLFRLNGEEWIEIPDLVPDGGAVRVYSLIILN